MTEATVHALNGAAIWTGVAAPDLVAALEDALSRARSGEIVAVAVAMQYRDKSSGHTIAGAGDKAPLLGALAMLQYAVASQ